METNDEIYILINQYLQSTHAATHQQYKMQIEQIFAIEKDNEKDLFHDVGNKMLLWYEKIFSGI